MVLYSINLCWWLNFLIGGYILLWNVFTIFLHALFTLALFASYVLCVTVTAVAEKEMKLMQKNPNAFEEHRKWKMWLLPIQQIYALGILSAFNLHACFHTEFSVKYCSEWDHSYSMMITSLPNILKLTSTHGRTKHRYYGGLGIIMN